MKLGIAEMQIGKNGLTDGTINWIENAFKTRMIVKINVLKSAGHTKEKVKEIAEEILKKLGRKYTARILGFVINLRKWKREVKQQRDFADK